MTRKKTRRATIRPPAARTGAGMTRRDLLRLAPATAAAVAVGCSSPPSLSTHLPGRAGITGTIVGASHQIGHRLREGGFPVPQETRDVGVVIVGGGMAGLSAAWKLSKSGFHDYLLLELEAEAGGNSRSGQNEVSAYPWGAHYLPVPPVEAPAVRELLEEMGLVDGFDTNGDPIYDPRHLCHAPQERVFVDGAWRDGFSAQDLVDPESTGTVPVLVEFEAQIRAFQEYRDAQGRRAFALPVAASTTDAAILALDDISMRDYFDRAGWSSEPLRWYVDYCCRDDYGCTLETTSAWAGWHYFCSRPADGQYLTWPEGNGRIVRHVMERVGDHVRTGTLVYRVRTPTDSGGADAPNEGVEVDVLDVTNGAGGQAVRYRARRAIYALPRFTAGHVIDGYTPPAGADAFTYCPWMVANLTVDRLPDNAAWDNVLYGSPSLGYVVATHQNLRIAPGPSVLTYYRPLSVPNPEVARIWMLDQSWDDWVSLILADLSQAHPDIESLVTHVDVMLWGHAMIRPVPGFVWGPSRRGAAAPYGAVRFAHSDMSGISLFEEAQYHGVRAAEAVMRDLGHAHASSV
ncbi:MAG: NAD(P)-binding protein [Acidobacteria bacterium]|nr:NAD(P)-binding protein [Acidobacteriota bacterium]